MQNWKRDKGRQNTGIPLGSAWTSGINTLPSQNAFESIWPRLSSLSPLPTGTSDHRPPRSGAGWTWGLHWVGAGRLLTRHVMIVIFCFTGHAKLYRPCAGGVHQHEHILLQIQGLCFSRRGPRRAPQQVRAKSCGGSCDGLCWWDIARNGLK